MPHDGFVWETDETELKGWIKLYDLETGESWEKHNT